MRLPFAEVQAAEVHARRRGGGEGLVDTAIKFEDPDRNQGHGALRHYQKLDLIMHS